MVWLKILWVSKMTRCIKLGYYPNLKISRGITLRNVEKKPQSRALVMSCDLANVETLPSCFHLN